jgi:hypothetical protein
MNAPVQEVTVHAQLVLALHRQRIGTGMHALQNEGQGGKDMQTKLDAAKGCTQKRTFLA